MTHAELVQRACRWLTTTRRCSVVFAEIGAYHLMEIPDAIGFRADGRSIVVECKISRPDFLRDRRKPARLIERSGGQALGDERWYLVEPGTIDLRPEAPAGSGGICYGDALVGWGVLVLNNGRCYRRVEPDHGPSRGGLERRILISAVSAGKTPWELPK